MTAMLHGQVALTTLVRFITVLLMMVSGILVARLLGPTGQGVYVLVGTFAATIVQFATLGMHSSNTYLLARNENLREAIVANSVWVSLLGGGLAAAGTTLVCQSLGWRADIGLLGLWLGAASVPPRLFFLLGSHLLLALGKVREFNLAQLAVYLGLLASFFTAGLLHSGVSGYLVANIVAWSAASLSLFAVLVPRRAPSLAANFGVLREGFRYAAKVHLTCLLGFAVLRANVFLLQFTHGATEVGHYSVAAQLVEGIQLFPGSMAMILFPYLLRNGDDGWGVMLRIALVVAAYMLLIGAVALLAVDFLVDVAFGPSFAPAGSIFRWMLPGAAFYALTGVLSQYLAANGFPRVLIAIWGAGLVTVCGLGSYLIPMFSGVGAAMSLSIAYGVVLVLVLLTAARRSRILHGA